MVVVVVGVVVVVVGVVVVVVGVVVVVVGVVVVLVVVGVVIGFGFVSRHCTGTLVESRSRPAAIRERSWLLTLDGSWLNWLCASESADVAA